MIISVGDLKVNVQIDGPRDRPAVVLLHSLGTDLSIWDAQAAMLSTEFHVVRFDLRGHGLTGVTKGPYTIGQLADDTLALMDALGIARAHVAGLSIGGLIAQSIAYKAPARVRSLMLVDTALAIPPAEMWRERARLVRTSGMQAIADMVMARWVTPPFLTAPAAVRLRKILLATVPEGYAAAAEAIGQCDLTASSASLRLPTLVMLGEGDVATPLASSEALRDAIPGARLEVIPDAAHIASVENPAAIAKALWDFLRQNPG